MMCFQFMVLYFLGIIWFITLTINSISFRNIIAGLSCLTLEVALGTKVADGQPQDTEAVQLAQDILLEGQKVGEGV